MKFNCLLVVILYLLLMGKGMAQQLYELPQNCDFINDDARICAPQLTPKYDNPFIGVLINSPSKIV